MKNKSPVIGFIPVIVWFVLICVLLFMPASDVPTARWMQGLHIDKVVHFGLFFVLIVLYSIPILRSVDNSSPRRRILLIIGSVVAITFGILAEFIQRAMDMGRSFDIGDWTADSLGVLAAVYLIWKVRRMFPGRKTR